MEAPAKGSVTSISSMFSPDEALSAVKRVQDSITNYNKEIDHVCDFIAENKNVISLVQRLPDELHHDIMVPFGKAAFFPGQLLHTNEFLVLLGEGYYAERTSKQTVEILNRRGKVLESQVVSLKAMVQDLTAEATFFDATASEAAEGLVEIREEYIEDGDLPETFSKRDSSSSVNVSETEIIAEDEYATLMSKLDELEKQELAALNEEEDKSEKDESAFESDEDEDEDEYDDNESDENNEDMNRVKDENQVKDEDHSQKISRLKEIMERECMSARVDELNEDSEYNRSYIDERTDGKTLSDHVNNSRYTEAAKMFPDAKQKVQRMPRQEHEVSTSTTEAETNSLKAFTCSIVEHTHNLPMNSPRENTTTSSQPIAPQPSKPVSRFKMNRR